MGLILYRALGFQGAHKHVIGRDEVDLGADGWDDANSAQVHDGSWRLYKELQHLGPSHDLTPGNYPDLVGLTGFRPKSVELLFEGPVPYGLPGVILHRHAGYRGEHKHIVDRDEPNLHEDGWGDEVSAIQVVSGRWRFHQHINYGGWGVELCPGLYPIGRHGGIANDQLSSVRQVAPHWLIDPLANARHAVLYEHHLFRGRHRHLLIGGDRNLHISGFGDRVSSMQISAGAWHVYEHVDYGGQTAVVDAQAGLDYPNAASLGLANDTMSSVRSFVVPVLAVMVEGYTRAPPMPGQDVAGPAAITADFVAANDTYRPRGIAILEVGRLVVDAPDLRDHSLAQCPPPQAVLTPEAASLYEIGRRCYPSLPIAFYTRYWGTESGCYSDPAGPAVTVSRSGSRWTLAHELGHLLGLIHEEPVAPNDPVTFYGTSNLMHPDTHAITKDPPDILDDQFAKLLLSDHLV